MRSKEKMVLELFFNEPSKEWHFEEILRNAKIARSKADGWLKRFIRQGLVKRIKKRGEMPYYIALNDSPEYRYQKRVYAQDMMHECGLLNHLLLLEDAHAVIVFGSFSRSDWYKKSDIDIFIYGNPNNLEILPYEMKLGREIQVFICKNREDLRKYGGGLMKNVIKGDLIKGELDFLKVEINA
jgi:predicted nucleotidyltransferase